MPDRQLLGYQLRAKGWERNHPENVKKSLTLFGIDKFITERRAILVESPLDAVRLASVGYDGTTYNGHDTSGWVALASFGAAVSPEQMDLVVEHFDDVLVAMDNDKAGWAAVNRIWSHYRRRLNLSFFNYSGTDAKDVGDMLDDEIHEGVETARPLPLRPA
jgi:DNA primase